MDWESPQTPQGLAASRPSTQPQENEFDLLLCVRVLLEYWWFLAPLAVLSVVFGFWLYLNTDPVYRATCRVEIYQNQWLQFRDDIASRPPRDDVGRHIVSLQSANLKRRVKDAVVNEGQRPDGFDDFQLVVKPVKEADGMVDVYVDSWSADYSLAYLQRLLDEYAQVRREDSARVTERAMASLRDDEAKLSQQLKECQDALIHFETANDIRFMQQTAESDQILLNNLLVRQNRLRTQLEIIDAQFPFLKDADAAMARDVLDLTLQLGRMDVFASVNPESTAQVAPEGWSDIPEWRENEARLLRLRGEYQQLLGKYKPAHPRMRTLDEAVKAAERELAISAQISLKRLRSIRDAMQKQQDALFKAARDFRNDNTLAADKQEEYSKLKARLERLQEKHDKVYKRIIDNAAANYDNFHMRAMDGPSKLEIPVSPIRWKILLLSAFGITGGGVMLVLSIYIIKAKLYNIQSLESPLGLRCLAAIPRFSRKVMRQRNEHGVVAADNRNDIASECYRSLRTNIEQQLGDGGKVILVTSPDPGEGKSFTSLNLAAVFAWSRERVLLVDCDFRRVALRKFFPGCDHAGITDCLEKGKNWRDLVHETKNPNLSYLPAGHTSKRAAELLTLAEFSVLFAEITAAYDVVVLDSAPVNRVVDSILLARNVDGVVMVAKAGKTTCHAIRYCHSRLGNARILGYVLNGIDASARKYGYYYHGQYGYTPYAQQGTYYRATPEMNSDA